jgi:hypothetical protein
VSNGDETKIFPINVIQNPSSHPLGGQEFQRAVRAQTENILAEFLRMLPDNYVSQISGPNYILQFQALAEVLAEIQITAQEVFSDSDFDFTRSEFLFQILGSLVFPKGETEGIPVIEGDTTYRDFLKSMVELLLQGAIPDSIQSGIELLTDADITVIEKSIAARNDPQSAWGFDDQFSFEINVSAEGGTAFPEDPITLAENVRLVMQALKPAHTVFDYRHLFLDSFGDLFSGSVSWDIQSHYYDDFRKYCDGAKSITGTLGETFTDRRLFQDVTRGFGSVSEGATLKIESGANQGQYRVEEVLAFPIGTDSTPRSYTTSPSGLVGQATVLEDSLEDFSQDFAGAVEGETLTFSSGPNAGSYRLVTLLGLNGGPVGKASGPATSVRVDTSLLRLTSRMPTVATGQTYSVEVDRLGVRVPQERVGEDASIYFVL